MTKKMTKKDYFTALLAIEQIRENEELSAFINHELEQLEKKSSGKRAETENQKNNEEIKSKILSVLSTEKEMSISDIQKAGGDSLSGLSNQKMNALILQLKKAEKVERVEIKGRAYFVLAGTYEVKGE